MRAKLTSVFVESVKPPETGQVEYWDGKIAGFGLRVSQGGTKTWVLMYRFGKQLKRMKLGTFPILTLVDAREEARKRLSMVQRGIDPLAEKEALDNAETFEGASRQVPKRAREPKEARIVRERRSHDAEGRGR